MIAWRPVPRSRSLVEEGAAEPSNAPGMELRGVFAILPTPFDERGEIDWDSLSTLVEFEIVHGVDGLVVLGILGEVLRLDDGERRHMTERTCELTAGRVPVAVGTGHSGTRVVAGFSRHAQDAGAAAVLVMPPLGGRSSDGVLVEYYAAVASAVSIPVVVQDEPATTGVLLPPALLARIVREIPGCRYVKLEEPPTPRKLSALLALAPDARVFGGLGAMYLIEELHRGAVGTMTGFAFPEALVEVARAWERGDRAHARAAFDRWTPLIRFEAQQGVGLAIRKEVLQRRGAIRTAALRHPGQPLDPATSAELDEVLAAAGFRDLAGVRA